jgi:SAM-dependent methyltransferase
VRNADQKTVQGFGEEWTRFDQAALSAEDRAAIFQSYFSMVDWPALPANAVCADIGCGSGRWAAVVAPKVGTLHAVDASDAALEVAKINMAAAGNVVFHRASVDALPFPDSSLDFAYSLGVLHHVPDTQAAISSIAQKIKPGGKFLIYLYYAFDNRPAWFRGLWRLSDLLRGALSNAPAALKNLSADLIALTIYWPLARTAKLLERMDSLPASWPLAIYRDRRFYVMRTDALDRFGTRLEQRFTRVQIEQMLTSAGFEKVQFSPTMPFWVGLATKPAA